MKRPLPALNAFADLYEKSKAGRTGLGSIDFQPELETVLKEAGCWGGDEDELARRELERAATSGIIALQPTHKRVSSDIYKVRFSPANEAALYSYLNRPSPTHVRQQWSALFLKAAEWPVAIEYTELWKEFCLGRSQSALHWESMAEFRRSELEAGHETLGILSKLLCWKEHDIFVRAASCRICGDSKRLENQRGALERLLNLITAGRVRTFEEIGILRTPRHVLVSGPLILRLGTHVMDLSQHRDGLAISENDIEQATIECSAKRCVTVENKTSFHQRAVQISTDLHIHTSYPGSATLSLLRKLPVDMEFIHYGDADPAGFDILRELREVTGLPFRSRQMVYHSAEQSSVLSPQEVRLLTKLLQNDALLPEREALAEMLERGQKGAFEQEHRVVDP